MKIFDLGPSPTEKNFQNVDFVRLMCYNENIVQLGTDLK